MLKYINHRITKTLDYNWDFRRKLQSLHTLTHCKMLCLKNEDEETGISWLNLFLIWTLVSLVLRAKLKVGKTTYAIRYLQTGCWQIFLNISKYTTQNASITHKYCVLNNKKDNILFIMEFHIFVYLEYIYACGRCTLNEYLRSSLNCAKGRRR